jgi:hypothetical protein
MQTQVTTRERNQMLLSYLETPGLEKKAVDAVNNFTRTKMREDSFHRKLVPPTQITNEELDRQVDTDKPVKVIDKEADSPAAISLPFANLPINIYIKAPRYRVLFDRIVTPRFTKDVDELRTYVMDIRQVLSTTPSRTCWPRKTASSSPPSTPRWARRTRPTPSPAPRCTRASPAASPATAWSTP